MELTSKGQRSRVEAYEMTTENALTVCGDVRIESGELAGIDNGKVIDESESSSTGNTIMPTVNWYRTKDGHTLLTGSAELETAAAAIPVIRTFVEAVKSKYATSEVGKGAEA